jgi:hypothetical protein
MKIAVLLTISAAVASLTSASNAARLGGRVTSCTQIPSSKVHEMLGTPAGPAQVQKNGPVSVCTYEGTIVRVETAVTSKQFQFGRTQFGAHGEPTKSVPGLGDSAYSSVIGAGVNATRTVVVLKGNTELLVTGQTPLQRIETFERSVVPSL